MNGKYWTETEIERLTKEYQRDKLSVQDIAGKHDRSAISVITKIRRLKLRRHA